MMHYSSIIQLIKNGQYTFYTNAIEKISFFVFFVLAARTSSLNEYGNLIAVFTFANILSYFLEFGFGAYLQRESSSDNAALTNEYSAILLVKIFFYFPYILLCQLYFYFSTGSSFWLVFVIGSLAYLFNFNTTLNGILFGRKLFRQSFSAHLFGRIFFLVLAFSSLILIRDYILFPKGWIPILIFFFIGAVVHLATIWRYLHNIGSRISLNELQFSMMKKILSASLPIGLGTFFAFAYDKIDVLLIREIMNSNAVAIYSAGYSLYKLPIILTPVLLIPLFTDLSSKLKSSSLIDTALLKKAVVVLLIYAAACVIVLFFLSKIFITIIYGEKFIDSVNVTKLLAFALPGLFLNNLTGVALNSIGKEKYQFLSTSIGVVINIIANIFLITQIGIYGAVYSTILTETFVFLLQAYFLAVFLKKNKTELI